MVQFPPLYPRSSPHKAAQFQGSLALFFFFFLNGEIGERELRHLRRGGRQTETKIETGQKTMGTTQKKKKESHREPDKERGEDAWRRYGKLEGK